MSRSSRARVEDLAAGGEVGALDVLAEVLAGQRRVADQRHQRLDDLAQVVRRDVGRHADGDAGAAVDQQLRNGGRQHDRLAQGGVVVVAEVDGLVANVAQQLFGDRAPGAPRCSAWRRGCRRRASRSCPRRAPAGSAARTAAPCAPSPRTRRRRRADGTSRAPRRRPRPTCAAASRRSGAGSGTWRTGCAAAPASARRARRAARAR